MHFGQHFIDTNTFLNASCINKKCFVFYVLILKDVNKGVHLTFVNLMQFSSLLKISIFFQRNCICTVSIGFIGFEP